MDLTPKTAILPAQVGIAPPQPDSPGAPEPAPVDRYARPQTLRGLPREVILYQYEVCPFCNKVRAVLDYYKVSSHVCRLRSSYALASLHAVNQAMP